MSDSAQAILRMAAALEEQNQLHQRELQQARLDEAARLELAAAERERAEKTDALVAEQARHNRLLNELLDEVRALVRVTNTLLDMRQDNHGSMGDKIDSILELQRVVVSRMLRDISDQAELDRITAILREATGTRLNVQSGGLSVQGGRDASASAGQDITSKTS